MQEQIKKLHHKVDETIKNIGGGFFTAILNDHQYYDENMNIQDFQDGCLYYPSAFMQVLGIHTDDEGESLLYQDQQGEPRFTFYTNISFVLSKINNEHVCTDDPLHCIATYDSYLDLPSWMGVDCLVDALRNARDEKVKTLDSIVDKKEVKVKYRLYQETAITTIVLVLETLLVLPAVPYLYTLVVQILFILGQSLILTRFIGRSIRLYHEYIKSKELNE